MIEVALRATVAQHHATTAVNYGILLAAGLTRYSDLDPAEGDAQQCECDQRYGRYAEEHADCEYDLFHGSLPWLAPASLGDRGGLSELLILLTRHPGSGAAWRPGVSAGTPRG